MLMAFDIANTTGWCAGDGSEVPASGVVTLPTPSDKDELGPVFDYWDKWLGQHLDEWKPERVIYEAPTLPRPTVNPVTGKAVQTTTLATTRRLYSMQAFLEVQCIRRGIPCFEAYLQTVKKELTGNGRADKADMVAMAKRCGLNPKSHDEADAFAVWLVAVRYYAKQHQEFWDKRIYSGRGFLT